MTDDELITELAENAFIAYGNAVGWINVAGKPVPVWADLGDTVRHAWKAATARICADLLGTPTPNIAPGLAHVDAPAGAAAQLIHAEGVAARVQQIQQDLTAAGALQAEQGRPYQGGVLDAAFEVGPAGKLIPRTELLTPEGGLPPKWSQPLTGDGAGVALPDAIADTAENMRDRHRLDTDPGRGQYDDSDGGDVGI